MKSSNRGAGRGARAMIFALCLGFVPAALWALASDREQPITVEADGVEINDRTGVSVYKGNVVIRQGSPIRSIVANLPPARSSVSS